MSQTNINKISVGIITANYNNGKMFGEYLDGLLKQTRKPNVITYIDDKSTDNSAEIVEQYIRDNDWKQIDYLNDYHGLPYSKYLIEGMEFIIFRCHENKGPATARNIGLKYLLDNNIQITAINDSDDIYYPEKISLSLETFKTFPQVGLVYTDYDVLNQLTGKATREYKEPFSYEKLIQECIVSNNSIFPTEIAKRIGFYDESLRGPEDYDYWLRISDIAAVHHIPNSLYRYTLTGNNITVKTPSNEFAEQIRRVHMKTQARLRSKQ